MKIQESFGAIFILNTTERKLYHGLALCTLSQPGQVPPHGHAPLPRARVSLIRVEATTLSGYSCTHRVPVPSLALPSTSLPSSCSPHASSVSHLTSLLSSQCTHVIPTKGSLQPPDVLCTWPGIHLCLLGLGTLQALYLPCLPWLVLFCFSQASPLLCSFLHSIFRAPYVLKLNPSSPFLLIVSFLLKEDKTETWPFLSLLSSTSGPRPCVLPDS